MTEVKYRAGGNPPISPGLFLGKRRITYWPAGVPATEERVLNIYRLWEASDQSDVFGPMAVLGELNAAGLWGRD